MRPSELERDWSRSVIYWPPALISPASPLMTVGPFVKYIVVPFPCGYRILYWLEFSHKSATFPNRRGATSSIKTLMVECFCFVASRSEYGLVNLTGTAHAFQEKRAYPFLACASSPLWDRVSMGNGDHLGIDENVGRTLCIHSTWDAGKCDATLTDEREEIGTERFPDFFIKKTLAARREAGAGGRYYGVCQRGLFSLHQNLNELLIHAPGFARVDVERIRSSFMLIDLAVNLCPNPVLNFEIRAGQRLRLIAELEQC
ncbi:hypothetical protein EVAR_81047_1 [Eumeta japonica]|uniref:Uncharacterized protein n=1 Tax=Eumeta variegata TaxID=151549 RepID=A0A4C1T8Z0_EUMVA|nr:hypothetical protein EVAR_81047_1 [Eumeta japonica]